MMVAQSVYLFWSTSIEKSPNFMRPGVDDRQTHLPSLLVGGGLGSLGGMVGGGAGTVAGQLVQQWLLAVRLGPNT
jgi:hypothetical protein